MSGRRCIVPLTVRLRGIPGSERLAEMADAITQSVAGRLRLSDRVIASHTGWPSWSRQVAAPELRFSGVPLGDELQRRIASTIETAIARAVAGGPVVAASMAPSAPLVLAQYRPPTAQPGGAVRVRAAKPSGTRGRLWFFRKTIIFDAYIGSFIDVADAWKAIPEEKDIYSDLEAELRPVHAWLVEVEQEILFSELYKILDQRARGPSRVRADQGVFSVGAIHEDLRQQLIQIDQGRAVAREIPSLEGNGRRVRVEGSDARLLPRALLLYASMVVPKIELQGRVDLGAEISITVRLRDLTFLVNPLQYDRFKDRFFLPWEDYLREFGNQPATVRIQPVTVRQQQGFFALKALVEPAVRQRTGNELALYGDLYVLDDATLARLPVVVRDHANNITNDVTRGLQRQPTAPLPPNSKAAFIYCALEVRSESVEVARARPGAADQADRLIPLIEDRLVTVREQWRFRDFMKENYSVLFPTRFEVLLDELKRRDSGRWFDRLFEATKEADNYELRRMVISLAKQTKFGNEPAVLKLVRYHNELHRSALSNEYNVAEQKVILKKLFGDTTVSAGDIFYEKWSTYVHEEKRFKPNKIFAPIWSTQILQEARALIDRIEKGDDKSEYTDEQFANAVVEAVFSRFQITEDNAGTYFDTITVQLSVQLVRLERKADAEGIETTWVFYQVVEREEGAGKWDPVGDVLQTTDSDFDYMIERWVHEHVSSAIITIAHISLAIAAIGVAWNAGVIGLLTRIGGGARVVIPSIILTEILSVVQHGFTFESLLFGAIDGYLGALFFRGAGTLARGLFGRTISTTTFREGLIRWIDMQIFKGVVGGGTTVAAIRFTHDVYAVATGRGHWSTPAEYAESIGQGAALGILAEFAGPLVLEPVLRRLGGAAIDVARVLRANGISPTRWKIWADLGLARMEQRLGELLESQPGQAVKIIEAFKILKNQLDEAFTKLGAGITRRARLSVLRQVLGAEELSAAATKGLERFVRRSAKYLDEDAALAVVNRIRARGRAGDFLETLNLLDDSAFDRLLSRGDLEGWLRAFERDIDLTETVRGGLHRLYNSALGKAALNDILGQAALPELLEFLGVAEQAFVDGLARQGYLSALARARLMLRFVQQPGGLERLRRMVERASAGTPTAATVDEVVSFLEGSLQRNPDLTFAELEGLVRPRNIADYLSALRQERHPAGSAGSSWDYARFPRAPAGAAWRPGDPINMPDTAGNQPLYSSVGRPRYWRNRAHYELEARRTQSVVADPKSADPIRRLPQKELENIRKTGKSPPDPGYPGRSMEIEHFVPQRVGDWLQRLGFNRREASRISGATDPRGLMEVTRVEHAFLDAEAWRWGSVRADILGNLWEGSVAADIRLQRPLLYLSDDAIGEIVQTARTRGYNFNLNTATRTLRDAIRVEISARGLNITPP